MRHGSLGLAKKKPIRNKGFHGKSDKKENAKKSVLVGYEDQLDPVRVKVYHLQNNSGPGYLRRSLNVTEQIEPWKG
jgi:hypothetical protein